MIHAIVLKKPTFDLPITVHIMSNQKNFNQSILIFLSSHNQASFPTRKTPFPVEMICTIWPGHTHSPSIVMLFLIQSGPTKVNSREADGPLEIEPDPITIVFLNKEPDPIKIILLNKEPDQIII